VQRRHPYTKGQTGGANNQHPHQTTSVHNQNLPCTRTTFQGSEVLQLLKCATQGGRASESRVRDAASETAYTRFSTTT
jgi:hypothetical protein